MKTYFSLMTILLLSVASLHAQIPRTLSFQGVLTDEQGNLVPDGNHQLLLKLFDNAANGNLLFTETQTVPVVNGMFNAIIGSVTPLPASLAFDRAYFLAVSVDGGNELSPRTALTAVPYALRAATAGIADALSPGAAGAVTSVNNQSGAITMQGAGGTTVTNTGGAFTISSTGSGATGIQGVQSTDGSLSIANPNGPVASLSIAANAVTSSRIADASITAADIAPGVLPNTSNFIANGSAAGGDLTGNYPNPLVANNTITGGKISGNAISTSKIADDAVTAQKIAPFQVVKSVNDMRDEVTLAAGPNITITPNGNVLTIEAKENGVQNIQNTNNTLDVLNGSGPAATINVKTSGVKAEHIADGAVTTAKLAPGTIPVSLPPNGSAGGDLTGSYPNPVIAANAVTSGKILDGTIATTDLAANSVTTAQIADGTISTADLAANSVNTAHIADGTISTTDLAANSVTTAQIVDGTIATADLAANSVTTAQIVDGTIATADIANNAVTVAKIGEAGATSGQVITYNGSDVVWQSPAGVSGTGVANRLAFWNGTGSLTSDANYTVTAGSNTRIALGFQCTAAGDNGLSLGSQCSASGSNTVAIGAGSTASSNGAVAVGVSALASGVRAHAIGNFVTAANGGSFVFGDANTTTLTSSAGNQCSMRFVGGYRLFSNAAFTTGVSMAAGVSGWTNICDRNLKEHVTSIDGEKLLDRIRTLPISEWSYKHSDPGIRYIGPMAQDFHEAFHLGGTDSLGINSIIADGVNLAAIQALEKRTRELAQVLETVAVLRSELATVRQSLDELKRDDPVHSQR